MMFELKWGACSHTLPTLHISPCHNSNNPECNKDRTQVTKGRVERRNVEGR